MHPPRVSELTPFTSYLDLPCVRRAQAWQPGVLLELVTCAAVTKPAVDRQTTAIFVGLVVDGTVSPPCMPLNLSLVDHSAAVRVGSHHGQSWPKSPHCRSRRSAQCAPRIVDSAYVRFGMDSFGCPTSMTHTGGLYFQIPVSSCGQHNTLAGPLAKPSSSKLVLKDSTGSGTERCYSKQPEWPGR